uniref:Uncharacterized protein n=1 Tax=Arundo donax TaxID=35708 RepID=A0A0A9CX77_ARUDO
MAAMNAPLDEHKILKLHSSSFLSSISLEQAKTSSHTTKRSLRQNSRPNKTRSQRSAKYCGSTSSSMKWL